MRGLQQRKALSVTLLVTFALGVAMNVVVFAITRGVLLKPLSFADSDRVVVTLNQYPGTNFGRVGSSVPNYFERQSISAFEKVAAVRFMPVVLGPVGSAERVAAGHVTPPFFSLLGIKPALGGFFPAGIGESQRRDLAVISDAYWRRHLNADPSVIGRVLRIDGAQVEIVGVLPRDFRYPSYPSAEPPVWLPLDFSAGERSSGNRHSTRIDVIARLRPNTTVSVAQGQLDTLEARLSADDPNQKWAAQVGYRAEIVPLQADAVASVRPALLLLQTGALFLLLLGAGNLVNLLIIRTAGRQKEFAVRNALGASPRRIAAQIVIETLALAIAGGVAGIGCGAAAMRVISVFGADRLPRAADIAFDAPIALMGLGGAVVLGLLICLPAIAGITDQKLSAALGSQSLGGTTTRPMMRLRRGLIVVQVALSFVLLAATGLFGLSLHRVLSIPPGFQPDDVLSGVLFLPAGGYATPSKRFALSERLLAELQSQPAVKSAGISSALPFASIGGGVFTVEGGRNASAAEAPAHYLTMIGGNYFETLGVPLRQGRFFSSADLSRSERVCIVDDAFAKAHWPGRDPLGLHVFQGTMRDREDSGALVVGVVGTVMEGDPARRPAHGTVYYPFTAASTGSYFYVTIKMKAAAIPSGMRIALASIDPELTWSEVRPLGARIDESRQQRRTLLFLGVVFAVVALMLALVGVHGVVAHDAVERRREVGIRLALGATPGQILALFLSVGGWLWGVGLLGGCAVMLALGQTMQSLLHGVSSLNASVFAGAGALLGAVVILACLLPSLRASRISPMTVLRSE